MEWGFRALRAEDGFVLAVVSGSNHKGWSFRTFDRDGRYSEWTTGLRSIQTAKDEGAAAQSEIDREDS